MLLLHLFLKIFELVLNEWHLLHKINKRESQNDGKKTKEIYFSYKAICYVIYFIFVF